MDDYIDGIWYEQEPDVEFIENKQRVDKLVQENKNKADSFVVTFTDEKPYIVENTAYKQISIDDKELTESAQLKESQYGLKFKGNSVPMQFIAFLTRNNWVFPACAERVANDIIKNGYDVVPQTGYEDTDEGVQAKEELLQWFNSMPVDITDVLKTCCYTYETGGKTGIEIIREDGIGSPMQYFKALDVMNVKLCVDDRRLLQTVDNRDCFFVLYGEDYFDGRKHYLNRHTGEWSDEPLPADDEAHEVLWFYRDDLGGNEHGVPRIIRGLRMIEMELGRENYNIDFFVNFGMPAWIVSITGTFYDEEGNKYLEDGTLNPNYVEERTIKYKIAQQIRQIIEGGRHGAIVMSYPTASGQEPVKVTVTPLATDVKEGSFRLLREDNKEDIAGLMGISSNLIGPSKSGALGNNALDSELKQHNDNKIKPTQKMFATRITKLLWFENETTFINDVRPYKFKLLDFITQDINETIERDLKLVEHGIMSRFDFQTNHSKALGINPQDDNEYMKRYTINGVPEELVFSGNRYSNNENSRYNSLKSVEVDGDAFSRRIRNIYNSIQKAQRKRTTTKR